MSSDDIPLFVSQSHIAEGSRGRTEAFWKPGDVIANNWEVRDIRYGGMGVVYLVFDRTERRLMVAKTCRPPYDSGQAGNQEFFELFKRECFIWLSLDIHPNIVQVHMLHEIHGWPFLFLEYVNGDSLRHQIASIVSAESLPQVCLWGIHICDGMTHALSKGLTSHDDLRPENCLVDSETNLLKITDFGLARTRSAAGINHPLALHGGSPRYMAPERFDAPSSSGICSDIYSLGIILFELVNGAPPNRAKTWKEHAKIHRESEMPHLSTHFSPLEAIVRRCLEKDPAARFQSFRTLRNELAGIYSGLTGKEVLPFLTDVTEYALKGTREGNSIKMDLPPELKGGQLYGLPAKHFVNKAVSLGKLNMPELALECCDIAMQLDPALHELLVNKGNILLRLNRSQEAIDCFDEFLRVQDPSSSHAASGWQAAVYNKAVALKLLGRNQEALECLEQIIGKHPIFAAFATKADILKDMDRWRDSLHCYNEAVKLEPSSFHCWAQMGLLLSEYGQMYEEGNRCYECALALDPTACQWRVNKGINLIRLNRYQEAIDCFNDVLSTFPEDDTAWYEKGLALCGLNENTAALDCFDKALSLRPDFDLALRGKGLLLLETGNFEAVLPCLRRARDLGIKGLESSIELCERKS